jgi:hypothetical protein
VSCFGGVNGERKAEAAVENDELRLDAGRLIGLLPIPKDSLTAILQVLIADRFRFVDLGGGRRRHRQALVSSFSLETHIDADDMPSAGDET